MDQELTHNDLLLPAFSSEAISLVGIQDDRIQSMFESQNHDVETLLRVCKT